VLTLPPADVVWEVFQERLDELSWDFSHLEILKMTDRYPAIVERLRYMGDNMARLAEDWRTGWKDIGRDA
jgi:hypothetical protein